MILSKTHLILVALAMVALCLLSLGSERRMPQPPQSDTREVWVIDDGTVAWRPMGPAEQAAIAVFSLGTALGEEWVQGRTMPEADAASFRGLSADYGVDRLSVWYRGARLPDADPQSFEVAAHGFARDARWVWRGTHQLRSNPATMDAEFTALSEAVYRLGPQAYYLEKALPELPEGDVTAYCRDWYQMNDALWLADRRLMPLSENAQLITCDGASLIVNGTEDLSENRGITLADGAAVMTADLDGQTHLLHQFDGKILQAGHVDAPFSGPGFMLVQLVNGGVYLADYKRENGYVQSVGKVQNLDLRTARARDGELWLGGEFYVIEPAHARAEGRFVRHIGSAEIAGDYVIAGGDIYRMGELLARPGDRPVEFLDQSRFRIGPICVHFGSYVSDLPETAGDDDISLHCDASRPPSVLRYDGLEIGFEQEVAALGASADGVVETRLGRVFVRNGQDDVAVLRPDFVRSVRFFVESGNRPQEVKVDYPALPQSGPVRLQPGEALSWPIRVRAPHNLTEVAYFLEFDHLPERLEILARAQHRFGYGIGQLRP